MTWTVHEKDGEVHITPDDDHIQHEHTPTCLCDPETTLEGRTLMCTHHSLDGRELSEQNKEIPHEP